MSTPRAVSSVVSALATVDLPEPDSPVSHTVAPRTPAARQRSRARHLALVPDDVGTGRSVSGTGSGRGLAEDHPRADGLERALVDEDEAAGDPVAPVLVDEQRHRGADRDPTELVERERTLAPRRGAAC